MTRVNLKLPGTPSNNSLLRPCQGKACNGAERVPEGGVELNANKWVCASCYAVIARRLK